MQAHAILINTARGAVIDIPALIAALKDSTIAGAGIDVLPVEPPSKDDDISRDYTNFENSELGKLFPGRIVNVASVAGKEGNLKASDYSACKAGIMGLTKSLGKELAEFDIAVNCVTPAAARTRTFDQMSQEHIDFMLARIPRGRFLELNEAAAMIS